MAPFAAKTAIAGTQLAQSEQSPSGIEAAPLPPIQVSPDPDATLGEPEATDPFHVEIEPESSVEVIDDPVAVQPLGSVPIEGAGTIDDFQGGLGARLWQGADPGAIALLMPQLPAPVGEPALRNLQLRLLLTKAAGPGAFGADDPLVPLRAERLHAMGFDREALALLQSLPQGAPIDAQEAFEKSLLAGDEDKACAQAREAIVGSAEAYWKKAIVYCQLSAGEIERAQLGIDILREQAASAEDSDFIHLAEILVGTRLPGKLRLSNAPDPLRASMMKRAGLPVGDIQGVTKKPAVGLAGEAQRARDASLRAPVRLEAAFKAFEFGLVDAKELADLCRFFPVAGDIQSLKDTPANRAQLFVAAENAPAPEQRARAMARLIAFSRDKASFSAFAPFFALAIERIPIRQELAWFAPDAFRVLLLAGKTDLAAFWLNLAQGSRNAPMTTLAEPGMKILAQWAGIQGIYDQDPVELWRATTGANEMAAAKLYAIFAALGQPIANAGANGLIGIAAVGAGNEIAAATEAGRRGEAMLRSLVALGGKGLANADASALTQSMGSLNALGLGPEARAIAVATGVAIGL